MISETGLLGLVIGVGVLSVSCMAFGLISLQRYRIKLGQLENVILGLESQLQTAMLGATGMGHRIVALEKRLQHFISNQENRSTSVDEFAYSQALQMFNQGADVETVASNCGFSNSEAQLMALLQKQLKSSEAAIKEAN